MPPTRSFSVKRRVGPWHLGPPRDSILGKPRIKREVKKSLYTGLLDSPPLPLIFNEFRFAGPPPP
jgi:hypothetical protein